MENLLKNYNYCLQKMTLFKYFILSISVNRHDANYKKINSFFALKPCFNKITVTKSVFRFKFSKYIAYNIIIYYLSLSLKSMDIRSLLLCDLLFAF